MSLLYGVAAAIFSMASASRTTLSSAYAAFRGRYRSGEAGDLDAVPYVTRLALFKAHKAAVEVHNAQPGISWVAEINRFADFTEAELGRMRGYRRVGGRWGGSNQEPAQQSSSFLEAQPERSVVESMDWRRHVHRSAAPDFLRNQGGCGSCWAVAAAGALEMHTEIAGGRVELQAYQQLVDCVPNPRHCGGTGGCAGATAELAFQYVAGHGLRRASDYASAGTACGSAAPSMGPSTRIRGHVRLAVNELDPVLRTLATKGPLVASVDATPWTFYKRGVLNSCGINATVNHAVLMLGYGTDPKHGKYFLIRNSWGPDWGEDGYIRLARHDTDKGLEGHCGVDRDNQAGVGCDGDPREVPVCGMCGVLSDSSYPTGVHITPASSMRGEPHTF
eukprot:CAMPEP_0204591682 /NCGR_PEP_ID=MMETSP0661-20131031/50498_1 /ASSEMBLY_ACC=CAM_ASM_000606 /TAXON_ID=109239 /ORGANISM="Alexandrium margalefi, Strain AMGDE01CS-322" /LENGTH=389 /DNA_ID=CAMNT_0051601827 /DNA_START=75 /DNA_END=1244 /DNA_ORIENTATION=-